MENGGTEGAPRRDGPSLKISNVYKALQILLLKFSMYFVIVLEESAHPNFILNLVLVGRILLYSNYGL
jgi:hypothetical protein